ncbi:hypothetical protein HPS59_13640, partial [Prevotella sp. PCJ2]|nr:hypothetical protein [Prevotella sp. PCJ2]
FICYKNGHTIDAVNAFLSTGMALSLCKDSAKNQKEERKFGFFMASLLSLQAVSIR